MTQYTHTPNIAFRHLPPRKDVVNQCLEFGVAVHPAGQGDVDADYDATDAILTTVRRRAGSDPSDLWSDQRRL